MNLPPHQQPSLHKLANLCYSLFSLYFLTPVNLMGEGVCDSSNESLLEPCWPQAGAVSRFERPCSDPQPQAEMRRAGSSELGAREVERSPSQVLGGGIPEPLPESRLLGHLLSSWWGGGVASICLSASTEMSSCFFLPLCLHLPETSLNSGALGISMP